MTSFDETSYKVAEFLLQIKAIKLQPENPFTWASGWKSPIYCDNRKTLSYPAIRTYIRQEFVNAINRDYAKPDVIAGVATAGIPHGALVADVLNLPFVYVRDKPKGHGLENQIEGKLELGQRVFVIEDLISTGGSSLKAVDALRAAGAEVVGLGAIFTYGFPQAENAFEQANCKAVTLTNYDTLLDIALRNNYIKQGELDTLKAWKENPQGWNK